MEKKLNISEKLDFNDIDLTAPEKVIAEILTQLTEETKGIICGNIVDYSGHVMSYTKAGFSQLAAAIGTADKEVDIQNDLGKIGQKWEKRIRKMFPNFFDGKKKSILDLCNSMELKWDI